MGPWHQAGLCLSQASRSRRRQVCRPYTLAGEGEIRAVAMTRRKITTCLTPVLQSKCIAVFLLIYHEQSHACTRIMKLLPAAKIFLRACGEAKTATNSYESHWHIYVSGWALHGGIKCTPSRPLPLHVWGTSVKLFVPACCPPTPSRLSTVTATSCPCLSRTVSTTPPRPFGWEMSTSPKRRTRSPTSSPAVSAGDP